MSLHNKLQKNTDHFVSRILSAEIEPGHVICDTLTCVMQLEKDKEYTAWVNIGSDNNAKFQIVKEYSHLRLYKL